jgi:hypothetical protein
VGRPGDDVYGGGVVREVEDLGPGAVGFAPDDYFAVVARRGEDVAVFGVGPGDGPDGAFVSVCVREGGMEGEGERESTL